MAVLGLAVWRIQQPKTTLPQPKATGEAGFCVDPNTTFHLGCGGNNTCVRKRGAGANLNGCVSVGQSCSSAGGGVCLPPSQTHLACGPNGTCVRRVGAGSNLDGCTTAGASCGGQTCSGATPDLCGTTCTNKQTDNNNCGICGNACTAGQTCTNGACGTTNQCPTGQTACSGVCKNLQTDAANCGACGTACTSTQTCSSGVCTATGSNEVNSCWGNGGTNGKCYDCNGDGEVNILDFSCFRSKYLQNVQ